MKPHFKVFLLLFMMAITNKGNAQILWQKCLGDSLTDNLSSIIPTTDGGYIAVGESNSYSTPLGLGNSFNYCLVIKLDNAGNIEWQKTIGHDLSDTHPNSIVQTHDGGYAITGFKTCEFLSGGTSGMDCWIVKLSPVGNIEWEKCLIGYNNDWGNSIMQTNDRGFIVGGTTHSNDGAVNGNHGFTDYWIIKLDSVANIEWQKCVGGSLYDYCYDIRQTTDGGYIVSGTTSSSDGDAIGNHGADDALIVKLDATGTIQWKKVLGGTGNDICRSVRQTADAGYILAGWTRSDNGDVSGNNGDADYWIVKLDGSGNMQWQKCLGGTGSESASSIELTNDGGYIVIGESNSNDGDVSGNRGGSDCWLVKLDATGTIQWQQSLGGPGFDYGDKAFRDADGNYIFAGATTSNGGDVTGYLGGTYDFWIGKYAAITGIEKTVINDFSIYPNPATNILNITAMQQGNSEIQYQLINTLGTTVNANKVATNDFNIDVSTLPSGIYFIHLQSGNTNTVKRFVKE